MKPKFRAGLACALYGVAHMVLVGEAGVITNRLASVRFISTSASGINHRGVSTIT